MKTIRNLVLAAALSALWTVAGAQETAPVSVTVDIEQQPLRTALNEFAVQTGLQILCRDEDVSMEGVMAPRVTGKLSTQEALSKVLAGTNLKFEFINHRTVKIVPVSTSKKDIARDRGQTDALRLSQSDSENSDRGTPQAKAPSAAEQEPDKNAKKEPAGLNEIVVTAQKREERTLDVPMSITAISGEKLEHASIRNALDLSQAIPGLAVSETGPGRQSIILRGVFSQRGTSSLTGVYLDEMPISGIQDGGIPMYADLRTIDLERIEVLKGPQGTLFGEGAAGGVVRFLTKNPDLAELGGKLSAEAINTDDGGWSSGLTGIVNIPLAKNVFGIRLAGSYEDRSGWIDQPTVNREDINDSEVKHLRAKALYAPTSELSIKAMLEFHRDEGGGSNIVNQKPLEESNFRQAVDLSSPTSYTNDYDLFNLTATYQFRLAELLSSTSHARLDSLQYFTQLIDAAPIPWFQVFTPLDREASIFSQELRLTSRTAGPLKWTVGAAYKDSELNTSSTDRGNDFALNGGAIVVLGSGAGEQGRGTSESWAGFADASYTFFDRLEIGGGLRQFKDTREGFGQANASAPVVKAGKDVSDKLTYRAYTRFELLKDVNLYASLATGFRSGGFNSSSTIARGAPAAIGPENTKFYEIGAKAVFFDARLRATVALFDGEYTDMQENYFTLSPVDGSPIIYTINGQDAEIQGVEWDFSWAATDGLTLSLAGDVTDSEIAQIEPGVSTIYRLGDPINQVPKNSLSATADWRFRWSEAVSGAFILNYNRQGKSYFSRRNSAFVLVPQQVAPEKDFVNVSISAEWDGWELGLIGRNLLDEDALLFPTDNGWSAQARPRSYGITISKSFY